LAGEELHVGLAVTGEAYHLLHPAADMVGAVLGLGEVGEQAVHALHLVADEPHVAADASEQLRLVHQQGAQPPQQRVHRALRHPCHGLLLPSEIFK
jgi:Zn-dependent alcohol dehydrogenase